MAENEIPTAPDTPSGAETVPMATVTPKKSSRAKKAPDVKSRATSPEPVKPKIRGLSAEQKHQITDRIEADVSRGATLKDAVKAAGISDQTYYQWKKAGNQPVAEATVPAPEADDEFAEFVRLEEENRRLRKQLSEKLRAENADLRRRLGLK